jgi:hypothetical protein
MLSLSLSLLNVKSQKFKERFCSKHRNWLSLLLFRNGETALHYAVKTRHAEVCHLLILSGADPTIKGKNVSATNSIV